MCTYLRDMTSWWETSPVSVWGTHVRAVSFLQKPSSPRRDLWASSLGDETVLKVPHPKTAFALKVGLLPHASRLPPFLCGSPAQTELRLTGQELSEEQKSKLNDQQKAFGLRRTVAPNRIDRRHRHRQSPRHTGYRHRTP